MSENAQVMLGMAAIIFAILAGAALLIWAMRERR